MTTSERIQELIETLAATVKDSDKHERGNYAAGTRLRKTLQAAIAKCKEIRGQIQDERSGRKD